MQQYKTKFELATERFGGEEELRTYLYELYYFRKDDKYIQIRLMIKIIYKDINLSITTKTFYKWLRKLDIPLRRSSKN